MRLAYQAFDPSGKAVSDVIEARDAGSATEELRRKGLYVTQITGEASSKKSSGATGSNKRIGRGRLLKNLSIFTRQLHVLISTGTTLTDALSAQERQTRDAAWQHVIERVRYRVEEGVSLSTALADYPQYFDPVYRNLIAAGEASGNLVSILDRLATLVRKRAQVRNAVIGAMVYPVLLLCVSAGVLTTMFVFVLPRFKKLFESFDAALPPTTQIIMAIGDFCRGYWWALLLMVTAIVVGGRFAMRSQTGKEKLETLLIRLPLFGPMVRGFATSGVIRILGVLVQSGIPLLEALGLTREAANHHEYATLLGKAHHAVEHGEAVSGAFNDTSLIDPSIYEAIRSGERSGQLAVMLISMADYQDEQNDVVVRSLTSILEPIILIVLGLIVGVVAVGIFLPLFDLTSMTGAGAH
ncbi:MAG: hypothetical protein GC164_15005 [Phycisphaera sp.]|nr:hypothetical protein [Phycisphaera sp.]